MQHIKTVFHDLQLILLGLVGALLIKGIPLLFSAERFSHLFYPYGGIAHEAIGAVVVSILLVVTFAYRNLNGFDRYAKIAGITAFSVGVFDLFSYLYSAGLTHTVTKDVFTLAGFSANFWEKILWGVFTFIFGFVYWFAIVSLPLFIMAVVKKILARVK